MGLEILESVPNFSEGRRTRVAEQIAEAARGHSPVLDLHIDGDHNRGVLSIAGAAVDLLRGVLEATEAAVRLIDLREHEGVHPRIGVMDVIPFVPVMGTSMTDASALAVECARRIGEELGVPTFIYGGASNTGRQLPEVRKEAFTNLQPDYGPEEPHVTAGAAIVGSRGPLVAYNVNLRANMQVAGQIANSIRESDGGLRFVRALAFPLRSRNLSQVSTNLVRPSETRIPDVYDAVRERADELGAEIVEAELVGLAPREAFGQRDPESVGLNSPQKILEDEIARIFEI